MKYESNGKTERKVSVQRPKSVERQKENHFQERKCRSASTQTKSVEIPQPISILKKTSVQAEPKNPNLKNTEKNSTKKFPLKRNCVRNTPVDLYQKYKMDWEKYKNFIPGENKRDVIRNNVREKMRVKPDPKPDVSLSNRRYESKKKKKTVSQ